jgi:RNA-binding protein Musashi
MRDAAGRSRCFAFLTFDDPASVNAVMVREHYLDGKIVGQSALFLFVRVLIRFSR